MPEAGLPLRAPTIFRFSYSAFVTLPLIINFKPSGAVYVYVHTVYVQPSGVVHVFVHATCVFSPVCLIYPMYQFVDRPLVITDFYVFYRVSFRS